MTPTASVLPSEMLAESTGAASMCPSPQGAWGLEYGSERPGTLLCLLLT